MVPLIDFRVKGKADALLAAKVIAPTAMAHIRILIGFIFCCLVNTPLHLFHGNLRAAFKPFQTDERMLISEIDVNNVGTLTQNEYHQEGRNQIEKDAVTRDGSCPKTAAGEVPV